MRPCPHAHVHTITCTRLALTYPRPHVHIHSCQPCISSSHGTSCNQTQIRCEHSSWCRVGASLLSSCCGYVLIALLGPEPALTARAICRLMQHAYLVSAKIPGGTVVSTCVIAQSVQSGARTFAPRSLRISVKSVAAMAPGECEFAISSNLRSEGAVRKESRKVQLALHCIIAT